MKNKKMINNELQVAFKCKSNCNCELIKTKTDSAFIDLYVKVYDMYTSCIVLLTIYKLNKTCRIVCMRGDLTKPTFISYEDLILVKSTIEKKISEIL